MKDKARSKLFPRLTISFTEGFVRGLGILVILGLALLGIVQATDSSSWNPGQTPLAGPGLGNVATLPSCPSGEYMVSDGSWWDCDTGTPTPEGSTSGFGDGSLGTAQFSTTGISQTGGSVDIDSVLSTGTKAGGPGASSYGGGLPSSNVYEFTVPNKDGQYDGDMTVVQLEGLTIDENVWLTTDQPGRGLLIYVEGDAVINGTLSMTARGAYTPNINNEVNPEGLQYPVAIAGEGLINTSGDFTGAGTEAENIASGISVNGEGKVFTIKREGADGAPGAVQGASSGLTKGIDGSSGGIGESGGGGSGGALNGCCLKEPGDAYGILRSGTGGKSTCFSGGSGSGSVATNDGRTGGAEMTGQSATDYGGQGGDAGNSGAIDIASGAGNPSGQHPYIPPNGTGGLLILIVGNNLTIGSNGKITAEGAAGGNVPSAGYADGGGSGGGNVMIFYSGLFENNNSLGDDSIAVDGGTGHDSGGAGGDGSVQISKIDSSLSSPTLLVNGDHTTTDCTNAGGTVESGDSSDFCRMTAASCSVGWTQYQNWSAASGESASGYFGAIPGTHPSGAQFSDCCNNLQTPATCTASGHSWSNTVPAECTAGGTVSQCGLVAAYGCPSDCVGGCGAPSHARANITQIGCY